MIGTQDADGVAYITQRPIPALHNYLYSTNSEHLQLAHIGIMHTVGLRGLMECMVL